MCGFIGRIRGIEARRLRPLTAGLPFIAQRGPDSQREWRSAMGEVELLHARLAIVDKTPGAHQPLSAAERDVTVAFAGEIYNYKELAKELDYRFATRSDTEVLLALYKLYGVAGLSRVKGMVACAIVDEPRRRVVLFRDAIGKKPLFVARWGGQLLFGSSLLPLVAVSGCRVNVAAGAAQQFWLQEFTGPCETALEDAEPVMPGEARVFDFSGRQISRERITPGILADGPADPTEADTGLYDVIASAVRRRLQDNPSPCLLLSGGIDSTALAVVMAREAAKLGGSFRALTLGALLPFMNDEPYARYAAARIGIPLDIVAPAGRLRSGYATAEACRRAIGHQDEPLGMLSYYPRYELMERVKEYSRIVLTGDGGDEVFLGYGQSERWIQPAGASTDVPSELCGPPLPSWMSRWGRLQNGAAMLGHNFAVLDRSSAEQGVEVRCPFLDWDVMALARALPPEFLLRSGRSKNFLFGLLEGWPAWFLNRKKCGFSFNLRWAWLPSNFAGLREMVDAPAQEHLATLLPEPLRRPPSAWRARDILQNFTSAWKLLVWSGFEERLNAAMVGSPAPSDALETAAD